MSTWQRIRVAVAWTVAVMAGGIVYQRVFADNLFPLIDTSSRWARAAVVANTIGPVVLVMLLLAVWVWVVAGAIQDERTVDRRRRVR